MTDLLVLEIDALIFPKKIEFEALNGLVAFSIVANNPHLRLLTSKKFILR